MEESYKLYIGAHVSVKSPDFIYGAIQDALSYDANACMIYTGAPQNSRRRPIEDLKIDEARNLAAENGWSMHQVIVHAPYIINLANTKKVETADFGRDFLLEELRRTAAIGSDILVLHPGSHLQAGVEAGVESIAQRLNDVLEKDHSPVTIALETMAGKGSEIGRNFEELKMILDRITKKDRIGICLDTCHIHDAGYDLEHFDEILDEFDSILGLDKLCVVHINDSKNVRGAAKDRHENIGKGFIGLSALTDVVFNPRLNNIIKILETPVVDGIIPYKEEIELLKLTNENRQNL